MVTETERGMVDAAIPGTDTSVIAYRVGNGGISVALNRDGRCIFRCFIIDRTEPGAVLPCVDCQVLQPGTDINQQGETT